ncbi:calcyphosin-2 isoform X3 [Eleutherodactylus coqui]|uniref:calcyphosin-2 isoform X3 n=1 Tax=Eleutherodactylus coqui TaxID=57060 RepID=UPI0034629AE1
MKNGYKQYTMREKNKPSARQDNKEGERPEDGGFTAITPFDDKVCLQHCYTSKPYTAQHSLRKLEAEDLAAERRKQFVVEQVMIDQLSRIKTSSTLTENMLSNKLRFDARILCRNGRDACRELIGFFFTHDKSITIYEYRQFGKNRTNALPFIQKGIYLHKCGRRRGKPYEIEDFYPGADLTFLTAEHQSLSESLRQNPILIIRITVIDEEALNSLRAICKGNKWDLGNPWNDEENIRLALQEAMKEKLKKREVRTLTGLAKYFRQLDISGSGCLGKAEFKQALQMYHLDISEKIFESFWLILNENNQGRVDYRTFIRALVGEMNEYRKSFVRKAFMKLDPNKTGAVSMVDIRKFYCAKKHPQVLAGSSSEEEIKSAFLETLENACSNPQQVSYSEFEDYYEGLSIGIMSDEDFINILRNSWGI